MNDGTAQRMNILRRDAEQKMLEPLRTHGWQATIQREGPEFLILVADRGGHTRRAALLYSSATDNGVYKSLATQVDCIFYNGEPYHVEQFARGVDKPVAPVSAFHSILVEWNKASAMGKFAPMDDTQEIPSSAPDYRFMLAEQPIDAIWLRLRQFQSVRIATKLVRRRAHAASIELDDDSVRTKAEGVAFALRNAIDYFQANEGRNVSQRVLNLYYGSLAFAFAEILAAPRGPKTLKEIEDQTKQGHGLYTVDGQSDGLDHLVVGVVSQGFFAFWAAFIGHDAGTFPSKKPRAFSDLSSVPKTAWHTLEDLFASIPEVSDLFRDTFEGKPRWVRPVYDHVANASFNLIRPDARPDRTYIHLVDDSARLSKEDIALFPGPISEIAQVDSSRTGRVFRVAVDHPGAKVHWDALPLHRSPFERAALIRPIFGAVGEYRAICVALLYALSIVVRYRPSIWRRIQEGDLDHVRVLIEAFMAVVERVLPEAFLAEVLGQRVFAKVTGSFY